MTEFNPQLKLLAHPERIEQFLRGEWQAPPIGVEISPTNACNAKCPWCFYVSSEYKQHHSPEELDYADLCALLDSLNRMGVLSVTWTGGGEPSVYTYLNAAIDRASSLGLQQGLFTNAYQPIDQPGLLDWIRITITEKFVLTKHVAEYAKATKVGVNFNLTTENVTHLERLAKEARDMGVDYFQVRPALADRYDLQQDVPYPLLLVHLMRLQTPTFRVILTDYKWTDYKLPHGYKKCLGHQLVPFVWHNGDVAVCAYHFGKPDYIFGNLRHMSFENIWKSDKRRGMMADGVDVIRECQHCCKLHEINKALVGLTQLGDVNFL